MLLRKNQLNTASTPEQENEMSNSKHFDPLEFQSI